MITLYHLLHLLSESTDMRIKGVFSYGLAYQGLSVTAEGSREP